MYPITVEGDYFVVRPSYGDSEVYKEHHWEWDKKTRCFRTKSPLSIMPFRPYWDDLTIRQVHYLKSLGDNFESLSGATECDNTYPIPEGLSYYPYQEAGIDAIIKSPHKGVLLADTMGLGKTIQSIGVHNSICPSRTLVICPARLKTNWQKEFGVFDTTNSDYHVLTSKDVKDSGVGVMIVNYDILHKLPWLKKTPWDLVIIDEAHYIKNASTKRYRNASSIIKTCRGKVLLLTGTPLQNRPIEMYYPLKLIGWPDTYYQFGERYCTNPHKPVSPFGNDYKSAWNLEELAARLKRGYMIRRDREEVLPDLPEKVIKLIKLPAKDFKEALLFEKQAIAEYDKKVADYEAIKKAGPEESQESKDKYEEAVKGLRNGHFLKMQEMAEARKNTALHKIDDVVGIATQTYKERGKVIIFAHHRECIEKIVNALRNSGYSAEAYYGSISQKKADAIVEDFQNGDLDFFVGNMAAAGVGLTLTASCSVIFAEQDWAPGNMDQCMDRAYRIGQENNVFVQIVVVDKSIDAMMAKKLKWKSRVIKKVVDA